MTTNKKIDMPLIAFSHASSACTRFSARPPMIDLLSILISRTTTGRYHPVYTKCFGALDAELVIFAFSVSRMRSAIF